MLLFITVDFDGVKNINNMENNYYECGFCYEKRLLDDCIKDLVENIEFSYVVIRIYRGEEKKEFQINKENLYDIYSLIDDNVSYIDIQSDTIYEERQQITESYNVDNSKIRFI